nr:DNA-directed RNA polymerases IV and V subunit 2-like [Ipomoea batatas]
MREGAETSAGKEKISNGSEKMDIDFEDIEFDEEEDNEPKKGDNDWRYASIKFGKVTVSRPMILTGDKFSEDGGEEYLQLWPRHARLQFMTYSARITVQTHLQLFYIWMTSYCVPVVHIYCSAELSSLIYYSATNVPVYGSRKSFLSRGAIELCILKSGSGVDQYVSNEFEMEDNRDLLIGRMPMMVNSDLCWMSDGNKKPDCEFDHGGYFIVKGAEKTFIAQEEICLKRLWVASNPSWMVSYRPVSKRKRVYIKLTETPKVEPVVWGGEKVLTVYFSVTETPIWIFFFALGVSSDREVVNLIDVDTKDTEIVNILVASIHDADSKCESFRKQPVALNFVAQLMKNCRFPPQESIEDCFNNFLFPSLNSFKQKARFLGYMVKCLLQAYAGKRKADNRDDFRNKRLELASELLERELRVHLKHAERVMIKAMQRDLYGDRQLQPIEHYVDASIVTNGL